MTPELQAIVQRLEEVEKQVAHLQALVTEQSDPDRAVVAQSFVVKDERGQRRAELGMVIPVGWTEAQPWLGLFDANDSLRACIGVGAEGPWLELYNAKGKAVALELHSSGQASLVMQDANGDPRLLLTAESDRPTLAFFKDNKVFWSAP